MEQTKSIKFLSQEKRYISSNVYTTDWSSAGTVLDASHLTAGNRYLLVSWFNCLSPGTQQGATKLSFDGGDDLTGADYQRHDTNSNFMAVQHIGEFVAPDPPTDIIISRKVIFSNGGAEETERGQCFIIDLTEMADTDYYSSSTDTSTRTGGGNFHVHEIDNASGTMLIFATARLNDPTASEYNTLISLAKNYTGGMGGDVELARGSKYTQDANDSKQIVFAAVADLNDGSKIKIKNLDGADTICNYSYVFTLNIGEAAQETATGQLATWTNAASDTSGSWGTKVVDGNGDESFVVAMGVQTNTNATSGRMASVSVKNNTRTGEWMLFPGRDADDFGSGYFPATNVNEDNGQLETAVVIGVGKIGEADEIEIVTS